MPRISIGLGLGPFRFDTIGGFWRWVDLCETGGIDSLWQGDRLIHPEPHLETLSLMAALAGRTQRLKFGFMLALPWRDPVLLAKQCATIDALSGGRLLPAFTIGNPGMEEWAALNIDEKTRGARTDEALEIITRLWTGDHVTFEGRYYRITDAGISPKPVQQEMTLWIGGSSDIAIRRTARFGTGWQAGGETPAQVGPVIAAVKAACTAAGRPIDPGHFGINLPFHFGSKADPEIQSALRRYRARMKGDDAEDSLAIGNAAKIISAIKAYAEAGVSKFVLVPARGGDDAILAQTRRLIEEVLPEAEGF